MTRIGGSSSCGVKKPGNDEPQVDLRNQVRRGGSHVLLWPNTDGLVELEHVEYLVGVGCIGVEQVECQPTSSDLISCQVSPADVLPESSVAR
jgi:hypothetical protein